MRYILISKTDKYGDLYFNTDSCKIYMLNDKYKGKGIRNNECNMMPPFLFLIIVISVFAPFFWLLFGEEKSLYIAALFIIILGILYLLICHNSNMSINKSMSNAKEVKIELLGDIEQEDILYVLKVSATTLYLNINRFLGVILLLAILTSSMAVFVEYPKYILFLFIGLNLFELYFYITYFSSTKRRKRIYKLIENSVKNPKNNSRRKKQELHPLR